MRNRGLSPAADRAIRHVAEVGGGVLLAGVVVAYLQRSESSPVLPIVLVALGALMIVAGAALLELAGPRGGAQAAVGGAGIGCLVSGPMITGWLGVAGVVLVAAALLETGRVLGRDGPDLVTRRAAAALVGFRADHGGEMQVALTRVGAWHKLVLVGSDGAYGEVVVRGEDRARAAAALAGVGELHEATDAEVFRGLRTGPYEWRRMAGSQLGR
jgi:hypothetical protein